MSEDHSSLTEIEIARQRGHFEGQVLSQLTDIKTGFAQLTTNYQNIETRTRSNEQAIDIAKETIKQIDAKIRDELCEDIAANTKAITGLIQSRASFTGGLTVIQLLYSGVVALVIALITAHFAK